MKPARRIQPRAGLQRETSDSVLAPERADFHVQLGLIQLKLDDVEAARRSLKRALAWEPDHHTAKKLYREALRREESEKKKKGFLSRFRK